MSASLFTTLTLLLFVIVIDAEDNVNVLATNQDSGLRSEVQNPTVINERKGAQSADLSYIIPSNYNREEMQKKERYLEHRKKNRIHNKYREREQFLQSRNRNYLDESVTSIQPKLSTSFWKNVHFTPLGMAAPVGPIQMEKRLQRKYGKYFDEDQDDEIRFTLPKHLLSNCWMQAMTSRLFSPSCNVDGTYGSKQCHNKRCWCSDKNGKVTKHSGGLHDDGYFFGIKALTLRC